MIYSLENIVMNETVIIFIYFDILVIRATNKNCCPLLISLPNFLLRRDPDLFQLSSEILLALHPSKHSIFDLEKIDINILELAAKLTPPNPNFHSFKRKEHKLLYNILLYFSRITTKH